MKWSDYAIYKLLVENLLKNQPPCFVKPSGSAGCPPATDFVAMLSAVLNFIDFLIERPRVSQNGLDLAIAELENGEYETYSDFDEFLKEVEHDS